MSALLGGVLAGCAQTPETELGHEVTRYDAATFFSATSVRGSAVTADGTRVLVSTNETGVFNVTALPVDGGAPERLTASDDDACYVVAGFPADDRILFRSDQGGNELTHLYVRNSDGTVVDLTPGDGLKARFLGFQDDGAAFFVASNQRDPQVFDLYRFPVVEPGGSFAGELVYRNAAAFRIGPVSRDGRWIATVTVHDNEDDDIHLVDLTSPDGEPVHVTPHEGAATHTPQTFDATSAQLWFTSDAGSEFERLWSFDIESGVCAVVADRDWDIQSAAITRDARFRVLTINRDARTEIEVTEVHSARPVQLPAVPAGRTIEAFDTSHDGRVWILTVGGDTAPRDVFVAESGADSARALTRSLPPSIAEADMVEAGIVRYRSFDGLEIPAVLYRPHIASSARRVPAIVWVHGGPGGQSRAGFHPLLQFLVNQGYALLLVNNRGSSGYGKTFHHLDDRRHGDVDLKDCVFARTYLEQLYWVDPERIAIMGGSYGGYMVAAALAFEPQAFDCGIDIFGVTNWVRTLSSIPPWWTAERARLYAELGDPTVDRPRLEAISPLLHAKNIKRPLLVVQGANDPRVLQVESDELVAAVRENGVPVEYIVFPDEGHGFVHRTNEIAAAEAYVRFLDEHLAPVHQ